MLPREYTLSQYDSSPPLTACKILVIVIDSSFVEQVENREYTCLSSMWAQIKSHLRWCCAVVLLEVTWPEVTWPEVMSVTWPEVTPVTWPEVAPVTWPFRKNVLRMRNRKLRNIRPSGTFWPEVTNSREWKRPYPEAALTGSMFCACPVSPPRFFLSSSTVVTWLLKVTRGLLTPSGFPWVCACGTGYYATYVVTEGTWPLRKCPLGRPRPIFSMVTGNSPGYLPLLFSYNASLYVITNYPDR